MPSREHFKTSLKAVGLESLFPFFVVVRIVCVQPIALGIDVEIGDLRQLWRLNQELLLGDEGRDQFDLVFVQVELTAVQIPVHIGVRKEDFGGATFDDYVEDVRTLEFVERLGGQHHCGVVFPPGLEGFDDGPLDAGVLQEHPRFIDEKGFENGRNLSVRNDGIGTMQNVEKQRFQEFRVLAHALEVEALKAGERDRVLGVVEEESELAPSGPFGAPAGTIISESICQHAQRAQRWVHCIQVLDLMEEIALGGWVELARPLALDQDFQEESQEVEILFRGWQRKRVDLEVLGLKPNSNIRPAEELSEAFKAPAQIEDEGVRRVLLQVGNQEVQKKTFSCSRSTKNHGVGHIAVVKV